jgi:hypothetical protein
LRCTSFGSIIDIEVTVEIKLCCQAINFNGSIVFLEKLLTEPSSNASKLVLPPEDAQSPIWSANVPLASVSLAQKHLQRISLTNLSTEAVTNSVTPCVASSCNAADQSSKFPFYHLNYCWMHANYDPEAAAAAIEICAEALASATTSAAASSTAKSSSSGGAKSASTTNSNGNVTLATGGVTVSTNAAAGSHAEMIAAGAGVIAALLL